MEIRKDGEKIFLDGRYLSDLDLFVSHVLDILSVSLPYVIVSGYVAILFGQTRSTEDVDVLIPFCDNSTFESLHDEFIRKFTNF